MSHELPRTEPSRYPDSGLGPIPGHGNDYGANIGAVQAPTLIPYQSKIDVYKTKIGGGVFLSPEKQRQIQVPVELLNTYSLEPTVMSQFQTIDTEIGANPYANAYPNQIQNLEPLAKSVDSEYPIELRPIIGNRKAGELRSMPHPSPEPPIANYVTDLTGWGHANAMSLGGLTTANEQAESTIGAKYDSTTDVGIGGLAFGTQAGAGLGFTMKNGIGLGTPLWEAGAQLDNRRAYKTDNNVFSYDHDYIYNKNVGKDIFTSTFYGDTTRGTTPTPSITPTAPIIEEKYVDEDGNMVIRRKHGKPGAPAGSSKYLDLTGRHKLCPPATMADRYTYCDDPMGTCGPDYVNITPIQGLDNHFYCTDPELPFTTIQSCPSGYNLVDNNSACVSIKGSVPPTNPVNYGNVVNQSKRYQS